MLIDTHCHLNFQAFDKDLSDIVRRAKEKDVEKIIIPGTDLESSKKAIRIAQIYPQCYAAVGIHPHHAHNDDLKVDSKLLNELKDLITSNKIMAIGETGMDFYKYKRTKYKNNHVTNDIKEKQAQLLQLHLKLAVIHNLPIIFHCRDAHDVMIEIVSSTFVKTSADKNFSRNNYTKPDHQLRGVWHCFDGSANHLSQLLTMGYFMGYDGNVTYSDKVKKLVYSTPLDRILLETDSPLLTPVPFRGQRNEPANLPLIAEAIAKIKRVSPTQIIKQTTKNARKLFNIS